MYDISSDSFRRAKRLYDYKLYSFKQVRTFSKYAWKTSKELSVKYGGSRLAFWVDMMWCNLRYGAMHCQDYVEFEFFRRSGRDRDNYITMRRYYKLIKQLDKDTFFNLIDKASVYKQYAQYIKRDWLLVDAQTTDEMIDGFVKKHGRVIVKPVSNDKGNGIYAIEDNDLKASELLKENRVSQTFLVEEICKNCSELSAINPSSLNTVRVFTMVNAAGDVDIFAVFLRCGCGYTVIDNWCAGGVGYPVDAKTGVVCGPGSDKNGAQYIIHPGTEIIMPGFKIPRYDEIVRLSKEIIGQNKKIVYAGLDFAVLQDRIELIEINFPAGYELIQTWDSCGKFDRFKHLYH